MGVLPICGQNAHHLGQNAHPPGILPSYIYYYGLV